MPDVREVYEMVTKQKPSDPGAMERQHTRQVRTMRNRKIGAFAVAAAIGAVAVVVILASLNGQGTTDRTTGIDPGTDGDGGRSRLHRSLWRPGREPGGHLPR